MRFVAVAGALIFALNAYAAVGFQQITVPDPEGRPLAVGIWYPSDSQASPHPLSLFMQTVAIDGKISGDHLPLILISHGSGGALSGHFDTALALAQGGFIAAAVTHNGNSTGDDALAGTVKNLTERPRQMKLVLDYLVSKWASSSRIDASRIGIFGFSMGGFTSLEMIGGEPQLKRLTELCEVRIDAAECAFVRQNHGDMLNVSPESLKWIHDSRIKAAVVAAPAVSMLYGGGGLRNVKIPVQVWRATNDDQVPDEWNTAILRKELKTLKGEQMVPNAGHYVFLAPCSEALAKAVPQICEDAPGVNRTSVHEDLNRSMVKFFREQLH
jgi:predicted dienelactone hydrolase